MLQAFPQKTQNTRTCPDGRICETDFGWVEPCIEYDCDDICKWGKPECEGTDAPPRPDCEILYCNSTVPPTPTPSPTPPEPTPPGPSPPSPTPPPGPDPVPPGPTPPPSPPLPLWKKILRIIGLSAASVLIVIFAGFGGRRAMYSIRDRYRAHQERRRRRENFYLRHRLLMDIRDFQQSTGNYEEIQESQDDPDSILVHIAENDEDLLQQTQRDRPHQLRQQGEREDRHEVSVENLRTQQENEEHEPIIRINMAASSVRMTRTFQHLKEKTENAKTKMKEKASTASATVKESTENLRKKIQSRRFQ